MGWRGEIERKEEKKRSMWQQLREIRALPRRHEPEIKSRCRQLMDVRRRRSVAVRHPMLKRLLDRFFPLSIILKKKIYACNV